jgi:hypothetical protein
MYALNMIKKNAVNFKVRELTPIEGGFCLTAFSVSDRCEFFYFKN